VRNETDEVAVTTSRTRLETSNDVHGLAETCRQATGLGTRQPVLVTLLTLRATAAVPRFAPAEHVLVGPDPGAAQKGQREVYWGPQSGWLATAIYERKQLRSGNRVSGPAVIEGEDTTYVIPPGFQFVVDQRLNGVLEAVTSNQ
ncbi:MAG: hypothetical protein ACE5F6_10870, partial [Anaerolineae bacterium]